jgi:hypothetical protein
MHRVLISLLTSAILFPSLGSAATYERGAMIRSAVIYVSPDTKSSKLGQIERGQELVVIESSREWLRITAELGEEKTVSGWILGKGVIRASTPNGDRILYGEAVDSEEQASRRGGRRGAGNDAARLYYRTAEYFPNSPLAAEALYRAADDKWQIEKDDVMSRPSAREQDPGLRGQMDDHWMKEVIKKYPATKWADLAAFTLLDNKLCGDWEGTSKCPVKESDMFEKYADDRPQSPAAPEALYKAAWRRAALVEIYKTEAEPKKSADSKAASTLLCQRILDKYPQSEYANRAQRLLYDLEQEIPVYGNSLE